MNEVELLLVTSGLLFAMNTHPNPCFKIRNNENDRTNNENNSKMMNNSKQNGTGWALLKKFLASFDNHEEACNMLCGKGQVRTLDLGYQSGALHCAARLGSSENNESFPVDTFAGWAYSRTRCKTGVAQLIY
jgi:hypothetical protein